MFMDLVKVILAFAVIACVILLCLIVTAICAGFCVKVICLWFTFGFNILHQNG